MSWSKWIQSTIKQTISIRSSPIPSSHTFQDLWTKSTDVLICNINILKACSLCPKCLRLPPWKWQQYIFKKSYVTTKLHLVHKTALNLLVEQTAEAEHGFEVYYNYMYRWQLNFELSYSFSSLVKIPFRQQVTISGAECEWQEKFYTISRV